MKKKYSVGGVNPSMGEVGDLKPSVSVEQFRELSVSVREQLGDESLDGLIDAFSEKIVETGFTTEGAQLFQAFGRLPERERKPKIMVACTMGLRGLEDWPRDGSIILRGELVRLKR